MTDQETVEIDAEPLAQFVLFQAKEIGDFDIFVPDGVEIDDVYDGLTVKNVDYVVSYGDGVEVGGEFQVGEVVGRLPAGPNRGYGPINPPESIIEDVDLAFVFRFTFEDEGYATGSVETL